MSHKNHLKSTISAVLFVVLIFGLTVNSFAANNNTAVPLWDGILSTKLGMSFDAGEGNATGTASKKSTATMIEGTLYLYELNGSEWVYIDEWYNSKTRGTLAVSGDFACESGVTYKAVFVVTAYINGVPETDTLEHIEVCP